MNDVLIYLFSILLVGYIVSVYFKNIENKSFKYKIKDDIKLSFILIMFLWCLIIISFSLDLYVLKIISLIIFCLVVLKEVVLSIIKLNYFNKEFKIILKNEDYNISNKIKNMMIKESLKNVFVLLGAPLLFIDYLINKMLYYIYG